MDLSAPTRAVFFISLILAVLAVAGQFTDIPYMTEHGFWTAIIAYVVLAIGNVVRGA